MVLLDASDDSELREIGELGVWTLSSCKPGYGVQQLRDGNTDTYWQSDGPQPHTVSIQFHRKVKIKDVRIFTQYKTDESYTPCRVSVRAGTTFQDIQEVTQVELNEPEGWTVIPMTGPASCTSRQLLRTWFLQIAILSNHQNGKDTHLRQVKIFAPREWVPSRSRNQFLLLALVSFFTTVLLCTLKALPQRINRLSLTRLSSICVLTNIRPCRSPTVPRGRVSADPLGKYIFDDEPPVIR